MQLGFKTSTRKFFPEASDLAIEVLSPNYTRKGIDDRLRDYFSSGTVLAWVIHPDEQVEEVRYGLENQTKLQAGGTLDGEHLLPGFRFPVADLFGHPDWE